MKSRIGRVKVRIGWGGGVGQRMGREGYHG